MDEKRVFVTKEEGHYHVSVEDDKYPLVGRWLITFHGESGKLAAIWFALGYYSRANARDGKAMAYINGPGVWMRYHEKEVSPMAMDRLDTD